MDGSIVFAYFATMCPPMIAHCRQMVNTIKLVLPSAFPSPQPERQIDQFSHFCTGHGRLANISGVKSSCLYLLISWHFISPNAYLTILTKLPGDFPPGSLPWLSSWFPLGDFCPLDPLLRPPINRGDRSTALRKGHWTSQSCVFTITTSNHALLLLRSWQENVYC